MKPRKDTIANNIVIGAINKYCLCNNIAMENTCDIVDTCLAIFAIYYNIAQH